MVRNARGYAKGVLVNIQKMFSHVKAAPDKFIGVLNVLMKVSHMRS